MRAADSALGYARRHHVVTLMKICIPVRTIMVMAVIACCAALCGCGIKQSKDDSDKVLAHHFQAVATNGYTEALTDYDPQFFQTITKEEWSKMLAKMNAKLGTYQSYSIVNWRSFSNYGGSGSGTHVSLQCQVVYSKHTTQESFTLFKGLTDSGYKIIEHHVDGAALLQD